MWESISDLEDKYLGQLFRAIFQYQIDGIEPEKHSIIYRDFRHLKPHFDMANAKYQEVVEKRKQAGASGGKQRVANQANASFASTSKQSQANQADNVNDNDNDLLLFNSSTSPGDEAGTKSKRKSKKKAKPTKAEVISFYGEQKGISLNTPLSPELVAAAAAAGWRGGEPETRAKLAAGYAEVVDYMMNPSDAWPDGMWRHVLTKPDQLAFDQFCRLVLNYGMTRVEIKENLDSWENKGYEHTNLYATIRTWKSRPEKSSPAGNNLLAQPRNIAKLTPRGPIGD